jgi:hypothetical protein
MAGYQACVDWPASAYWRELAEHYPDAKVLLSVRDPNRWYDSMQATIFKRAHPSVRRRLMTALLARWSADLGAFLKMTDAVVVQRVFSGETSDRAFLTKVFADHVAAVKQAIPPDRLLVFDVKEGWEPLCRFLDVPVPDEPFPRVNDSANFDRINRDMMRRMLMRRSSSADR